MVAFKREGGFSDRKGGRDSGGSRGGFGGSRGGAGGGRGGFGGGSRSFGGDREERPLHKATCSGCGRSCEVPFRPNGSKPVFCNECFGKNGGPTGREDRDGGKSFERPSFKRDDRDGAKSFERPGFDRSRFESEKMFTATCDKCGSKCEVPFRPTPGKPVMCSACFGEGRDAKIAKSSYDHKSDFTVLNAKLDMIIKALNIATPKEINDEVEDFIDELVVETTEIKKERKPKAEKKTVTKVAKKAVSKKK